VDGEEMAPSVLPQAQKVAPISAINVIAKFLPQKKQDHQRWGYSTVIHLEKTIYLAIWKDLNKEKRKEQ